MSEGKYVFGEDWFSPYIPKFLEHVAPLAGSPCALLEIGAYEGRATTWLADNVLTHPSSRMDVIDLRLSDVLKSNIQKTGRSGQITLHEGLSRHVVRNLPLAAYDFIYVDGSHQTIDVMEDAIAAFRLAKVGAIIAFDDYLWDPPCWNDWGVPKPAMDAFLELYARPQRHLPLVEPFEEGCQIWIRKLRESAY